MTQRHLMDTDDPWPLRSGTCEIHGEFNNFSGRCLPCDDLTHGLDGTSATSTGGNPD